MNAWMVNSLPKNGNEWAHVSVGKAWKIWKSPWWDLDCHANWAVNWLILMSILCLVWQNFNCAFHRWEKWNPVVHIDHGSIPKFVGLGWKYPSNDFQDPRESWRDAQDTEKEEWNEPPDFARLYWFVKGGENPSGSNRQGKGRWISNGTFVQANR